MDWGTLPVDKFLFEITSERNALEAFQNIIKIGRETLPSFIWDSFGDLNLQNDVKNATVWLQETINSFPKTKGIYLGLDTLNMNEGLGSNVEVGLNSDCDPTVFSDEWIFHCDNYGPGHLIEGLLIASQNITNDENCSDDERSFVEYLIFLGYGGIVLREGLLSLKTKNDFISMWGFHDGDMYFLVHNINGKKSIIANIGI